MKKPKHDLPAPKPSPAVDRTALIAPDLNPPPSAAKPFTGSDFEHFNSILVGQVCNTIYFANSTEAEQQAQMQSCLAAMAGIGAKDETEGMLAAQMVALHNAAMECFRRAMLREQPLQSRQLNLSYASKLTRTYALHMEALDKHRGKGQQTVRVEHVTVNAGGQAIVGAISHAGMGGVSTKREDQGLAGPIAQAPEPTMRSPFETDRQAMPQRRDGER